MKNKIALGAIIAVLTGVLAACGQSQSNGGQKQELNLAEQTPLSTIDLSKSTGYGQSGNLYEAFYRLGKNGRLDPGLAQSESTTNGGKTYTFRLRSNLKWSNGDELTAQDFVYSWRRTLTPKTKAQYAYLFSGIKNADAINAGKRAPETLGISAPNKRTVVVQLERPIAYFKLLMAYPLFAPQDQKVAEKYGDKYATKSQYTVYNGPFKLEGWSGTNNSWRYVKNNQYWDKNQVKLQKINYSVVANPTTALELFQQKKLSLAQLSTEQARNYQTNPDFKEYPYAMMTYLKYNFKNSNSAAHQATNNQNVRQAISLAVNRSQLSKKVLGIKSAVPTGFVPNKLAYAPKTHEDFSNAQRVENAVDFDPQLAKQKFAKGMKQIGESKVSLTLVTANDDTNSKTVGQYLKAQLEKNLPGLTINLRDLPGKTQDQEQMKGNFDISLSSWGADFNDPMTFLSLPMTGTSYNYGKFSDPVYDSLIKRAQGQDANHPEKRWQDLAQSSQRLNRDQSFTPLFQDGTSYLQANNVKGIVHNTAGTQWNYKTAYVQ
ncbi:peptide ABC transporter substrate-binding protein [Levilactobacillus bambusae]|uniref:Peptide ABC transporter substrate-binding protein n=1 Tax=Levilactobacillus bambusae TaxID=2024736 RepID=A0A2V1N2B8_9LACO|nr:peptide ABC transporter substrate-binding protein [Levilactobacillus bambusae]PWG00426.1 peptide ABC transporter substrate-binding protein [Levilactobacillus bambusae]